MVHQCGSSGGWSGGVRGSPILLPPWLWRAWRLIGGSGGCGYVNKYAESDTDCHGYHILLIIAAFSSFTFLLILLPPFSLPPSLPPFSLPPSPPPFLHSLPPLSLPPSLPQENRQRVILEEKRRKREEARKAAAEKRAAAKGQAAVPEEEQEGCVIDNLLKEIRSGTTLRPTNRKSVHRPPQLTATELQRLKKIAAQVVEDESERKEEEGKKKKLEEKEVGRKEEEREVGKKEEEREVGKKEEEREEGREEGREKEEKEVRWKDEEGRKEDEGKAKAAQEDDRKVSFSADVVIPSETASLPNEAAGEEQVGVAEEGVEQVGVATVTTGDIAMPAKETQENTTQASPSPLPPSPSPSPPPPPQENGEPHPSSSLPVAAEGVESAKTTPTNGPPPPEPEPEPAKTLETASKPMPPPGGVATSPEGVASNGEVSPEEVGSKVTHNGVGEGGGAEGGARDLERALSPIEHRLRSLSPEREQVSHSHIPASLHLPSSFSLRAF